MIDVSKFADGLDGRPVAMFGVGVSNLAAIKTLVKAGATVIAWDDREERRADATAAGAKAQDLLTIDLSGCACLVLSPGVAPSHPVVEAARIAQTEIICDMEILHRCGHGRTVIGVTGTNGKSTTTALTGHILDESGIKAAVGGNIGKAALDLTLPPKKGAIVLEMSSYQIDLCPTFTPEIAVLLNISPDHTEYHGSMDNYVAAKTRIVGGEGKAVVGIDDDWCRKVFEKTEREKRSISVTGKADVFVKDGVLFEGETEIGALDIATLRGTHNHQNIAAAFAVARLMGLEADAIMTAVKTYPGLPHRQYAVRVINGVAYINDSKATNAAAAGKALSCYRNIYWIAGGRPKEGGLDGLEPYMADVRHAFLIGEAADDFGSWLDKQGVLHSFCGTLEQAVEAAHREAQNARGQPGGAGTVLLSPACASFDQFENFEERGDAFTAMVKSLKEEEA